MKKHHILFLLCWIAYFSTYIGWQNYTASMSEIIAAEGYLNRTCGLVFYPEIFVHGGSSRNPGKSDMRSTVGEISERKQIAGYPARVGLFVRRLGCT